MQKHGIPLEDQVNEQLPRLAAATGAAIVPEHLEYLDNTLVVADNCKLDLALGAFTLPHFPIPPGFATPDAFLAAEAERGFAERYPRPDDALRERLRYELATIDRMGFAGYFLIVADFVRAARERGIAVGPGR